MELPELPAQAGPWREALKLIGVAVVAAGFALRLHPLLVLLVAGVATGFAAGIGPLELLGLIGTLFVDNLFTTLPIVLLMPLIGLLEEHGLQERAAALIRAAGKATAGRILLAYQLLREVSSMFGINLGGHAQMIRPLVAPMAEAAAEASGARESPPVPLPAPLRQELRAHAAAAENWGNFFADDIVVAIGPVLLMKGVFDSAGIAVSVAALGAWGLPTALFALLLGAWRFRRLDRAIEQHTAKRTAARAAAERAP